jgi:O-antigen/teichoic acid export membrane protein
MLFAFLFGEEWIVSGEFVRIFAIMYFVRFISSPLSYVLYITNKLYLNLILQLILLGTVWACIFVGGNYFDDPKSTMVMLSAGYSIIYVIYLIISCKLSGK